MKTQIVEGWSAAQALADDWRQLHQVTQGASLFNSFDFLDIWIEFFGEDITPVIVTIRDDADALVGLAGLQIKIFKKGPIELRRMNFLQNKHISRTGVLATGDIAAVTKALAAAIFDMRRRYDDIVFEHLLLECPVQQAFREALGEVGFVTFEAEPSRPLQSIVFEGNSESYLETRKQSVRKDIRRAKRRCDELDGFNSFVIDVTKSPRDSMREFFSLDWLSSKVGTFGALYTSDEKLFYLALIENSDRFGPMEMTAERIDGRLISSMFSIIFGDTKYLMCTYTDVEYANSNAGRYTIWHSVELGLDDPEIRVLDMNGGSLLQAQISNTQLAIGDLKANHNGAMSRAIAMGRQYKSFAETQKSKREAERSSPEKPGVVSAP
ncbi:MAG: GNAT family N-acetyltransferase [Mangrovicoccus sp.]